MKFSINYLKSSFFNFERSLFALKAFLKPILAHRNRSSLAYFMPKAISTIAMMLILFASGTVSAQKITVEGIVSDVKGSLPGVNVLEKGSSNGVSTDFDGRFNISTQVGKTLVFSFVGYKDQEIVVKNQRSIKVILESNVAVLNDVVVVGYGTKKKASLTAAVSSIKGDAIVTTKNENVQNMLTGKVAGLRVVQNSSEPGSFDNTIDIRGLGNPLIIIDGIPRDNMSTINPDDIESISVLKDASAAVYGVRAANGVILITTKKGTSGKMEVNYTGTSTLQIASGLPKSVNAVDYMTLVNESFMHNANGGRLIYTDADFEPYRNGTKKSTDWNHEVMNEIAPQTQHNLSAIGGNDKVKYFFSTGYLNQESLIKSDDLNYERFNLRSNISAQVAEGLTLGLELSGTMDQKKLLTESAWWIIRSMWYQPPTEQPYANGNPAYPSNALGGLNPVSQSNGDINGYQTNDRKWFQSSVSLDYDVPSVKGLNFKGLFSYDYQIAVNKAFRKQYNQYTYNAATDVYNPIPYNSPMRIRREFYEYPSDLSRLTANYKRKFGNHDISGMLLYEQSSKSADNFYAQRELSIPLDQLLAGNSKNQEGYMSSGALYKYTNKAIVGRVTYDYASKYLVEFSFRQDGSSKFSGDQRWGFFPTASAGWNVSKENFWKNSAVSFVNNFKVRASYGKTGDDSASSYQFITGYNYPAGGSANGLPGGAVFGDTFVNSVASKGLPNPNITWFTSEMYDVGVDLEAWNGLLGITFDYFRRDRDGLLASRGLSLPEVVGVGLPQENLNSDRTHGFDMEITHKNRIGEFKYNVQGTLGYTITQNRYVQTAKAGNSYLNWLNNQNDRNQGLYWGYGDGGRFGNYNDIVNAPAFVGKTVVVGDYIYQDWNGDGVNNILDQRPIAYTGRPMITFGMNISGSYKKLDFNLLLQGAAKTQVAYTEQLIQPLWANGNALEQFMNRYHPVDPKADPYDPNTQWVSGEFAYTGTVPFVNTSANVHDASYVRLKSIEVGYRFTKAIRVFANAYNPLTWTKLKYLDPEHPSSNFGYMYPLNRTFSIGLNLNL